MASFRESYEGWLSGLLQWSDVDAVFARVAAEPAGWYFYDVSAGPPTEPLAAADVASRLTELMAFLRGRHRADYCGFVYVDDRASPTLIKVYDPRNASACGIGGSPPAYTLSRAQPERLPFARADAPPKGIVARIFGSD